ncbi:hypothetical protein DFH06DRAFT_1124056 [Mycena polygramma]|nr:hypothetical protein DFH06DRAFT_1124056 [Mycena polygramma]
MHGWRCAFKQQVLWLGPYCESKSYSYCWISDPFHGSAVASEHAYDLFVFLSDYTVRLLIVLRTPPPPGQRTAVKGKHSPLKASSSDVMPNDNVIEVPTSSDEDMEAMDEDDSMFRKAGVKPSGAAKRSAVSEQDVEPPVKQLKPAARIRSKRYTPQFIKKMNDYMAKHKDDSDVEEEPPEKSRSTRTDKRVDFDDVELQRGIAASSKFAAKTASKKKSVSESLKQSSPDWEAPYDGTLEGGSSSANDPKSKSDKGKGKAVVKTEPSNKTAKVSPKVGKTIKTNPNSILAKFVGKDAKATMSQCFGGSDGEVEVADSEEESSDDDVRGPAQEVFLEDLETLTINLAFSNAKGKCGVSDPDLQDPLLAESYAHLPLLPGDRELVAVYDPSGMSAEYSPSTSVKGGRVKFSFWAQHIKKMMASNSVGAVVFERSEPKFINPSRISPMHLSRQPVPGKSESKLLSPTKIGGKSDRTRKWVSGIFHNQEWEHFVALICLVFGEHVMRAQLSSKKSLSFQTMMSPADSSSTDQNADSLFDSSAPADMFSSIVSTATPSSSKSRNTSKYVPAHSKTLLAHNDFVPVYDARKTVVDFSSDLDRLDKSLPMFPGEIPFGSFIVVGYTCSSYLATLSGSNERVPHLGCNVLWVIVCGSSL